MSKPRTTPSTINQLLDKRRRYLENNDRLEGGVVVIFNNQACGWMNELRDPQSWEPGCIAIDELGNCWKALGGNAYDGAELWEPLPGLYPTSVQTAPVSNNNHPDTLQGK